MVGLCIDGHIYKLIVVPLEVRKHFLNKYEAGSEWPHLHKPCYLMGKLELTAMTWNINQLQWTEEINFHPLYSFEPAWSLEENGLLHKSR